MRLAPKLILIFTVLSAVVLSGSLALLYFAERAHLLAQAYQGQVRDLEKLARVCGDSVLDDNELARLAYLKTFLSFPEQRSIAHAVFLDAQGKVLMHSDFVKGNISLYGTPASSPAWQKAVGAQGFLEQSVEAQPRSLRVFSVPVMARTARVGTAILAYDREALEGTVRGIQRESLLRFSQVAFVGFVLSLLFAFAVARTLTKPIQELAHGARQIGTGNLDHRIPAERKDELGVLAGEFNLMAQKLAELDELKDGFLAKITHDLRNPLGAIIGFADLMLMGVIGPLNEKQNEAMKTVSASGNYLSELVNNILDLTKLEAGKMEFVRKPTPLRACAGAVVDLLKVTADGYKVGLDVSGIPEVQVLADEQALRRILFNLVSNALKFTPEGGKVFIEYGRTEKGEDRISVRDTGIGIPEDKLKNMFQKFFQVAETKGKVRESKGTGLGLVICKEVVEGHGGRIWVESRYKQGTVFHFTLPREASAPAAKGAHDGA